MMMITISVVVSATPVMSNSSNVRGDPTPIFKFVAKDDSEQSHYDFGFEIGRTFSEKINARLDQDSDLEDSYTFVTNTSEGKQIYGEFLDTHQKIFPLYVKELEGIASGAQIDFKRIFVKNLILEIDTIRTGSSSTDHCSDYQMCTKDFCGVSDFFVSLIIFVRIPNTEKCITTGGSQRGRFGSVFESHCNCCGFISLRKLYWFHLPRRPYIWCVRIQLQSYRIYFELGKRSNTICISR